MHQPIGSSPYSPESSHSSSSPVSHSFSSGNSPMVMCASPNSAYMGKKQFFFDEFKLKLCKIGFNLFQEILPVQLLSDQAGYLHVYLYLINHRESFVFVMPLKWLEHMDVLWLKARNGTKKNIFVFKYVSLANVNIYQLIHNLDSLSNIYL